MTTGFIKKKLKTRYDKLTIYEKEDGENDKSLVAKQFKGMCLNCRKYRHHAQNCRDKNKSNDETRKKRFNGNCNYCGIYGHREENCFKKKKEENNKETSKVNMALMGGQFDTTKWDKMNDNTWIADSGATCHMTKSPSGLYDVKESSESIEVANSQTVKVEKIGKFDVEIHQKDGTKKTATLEQVKYVPDLDLTFLTLCQH